MSKIDWKRIAFWVVLFWFVYSAPTEGTLIDLLAPSASASQADF